MGHCHFHDSVWDLCNINCHNIYLQSTKNAQPSTRWDTIDNVTLRTTSNIFISSLCFFLFSFVQIHFHLGLQLYLDKTQLVVDLDDEIPILDLHQISQAWAAWMRNLTEIHSLEFYFHLRYFDLFIYSKMSSSLITASKMCYTTAPWSCSKHPLSCYNG